MWGNSFSFNVDNFYVFLSQVSLNHTKRFHCFAHWNWNFGTKFQIKSILKYIDKSKAFHISFHLYIWYTLEICGANLTFTVCMGLLGSYVSLFFYILLQTIFYSPHFLIWHQVIYLFECYLRSQDFIRHKKIWIIYDCCKDYENSRIPLWIENKNDFRF